MSLTSTLLFESNGGNERNKHKDFGADNFFTRNWLRLIPKLKIIRIISNCHEWGLIQCFPSLWILVVDLLIQKIRIRIDIELFSPVDIGLFSTWKCSSNFSHMIDCSKPELALAAILDNSFNHRLLWRKNTKNLFYSYMTFFYYLQ